jgi:rhamnogalacturonyl hydrolase YesR
MFLYGMAETRRLNLAAAPAPEVMRKAWIGLKGRVDPQGRLTGVSGGTRPSTKAQYAAVPVGTYTWGTGALLMAISACAQASSLP